MEPSQTVLVGSGMLFVLAIVPVLMFVATLIFGVLNARRKPPLAEQLASDYARKSEVHDLRADLESSVQRIEARFQEERGGRARLHEKIEDMQRHVQASLTEMARSSALGFTALERALGRIEGEINNGKGNTPP